MNKFILTSCILFITIISGLSQHHTHSQVDFEKIEAAKIAHITTAINLTPSQAESFWPLYNEYSKKRRELKHERKSVMRNSENLTDDKVILESFTKIDELRSMELNLDKAYRKKFLLIISPNQVMQLYRAEKEFYRMIMRKIHEDDE